MRLVARLLPGLAPADLHIQRNTQGGGTTHLLDEHAFGGFTLTGGDFEGQEGVFLKVKGARDRRVVIAIQGIIAVAMATIHPDLIEVIK